MNSCNLPVETQSFYARSISGPKSYVWLQWLSPRQLWKSQLFRQERHDEKEGLVRIQSAAAIACAVLTLAACGRQTAEDERRRDRATEAGPSTPTTTEQVSPESSSEPGKGAQPAPPVALGTSGQTKAGRVAVTPAKPEFSLGTPVSATVSNGLNKAIYTEDQKTACSIAVLERLAGDSWEPIVGCGYERAPSIVRVAPGEVIKVEIDPRSTHFGGTGDPAFGEGKYRLVFAWRTERGPEGHTTDQVTSQEFRVKR
jgi:hypothetical protein